MYSPYFLVFGFFFAVFLLILDVFKPVFWPQVLVNVLDVNDVTPTFPRAYEGPFEVTEGQPGPRVWTLRASDEDSGLNGKVEYSITGGDQQSQYPKVLLNG